MQGRPSFRINCGRSGSGLVRVWSGHYPIARIADSLRASTARNVMPMRVLPISVRHLAFAEFPTHRITTRHQRHRFGGARQGDRGRGVRGTRPGQQSENDIVLDQWNHEFRPDPISQGMWPGNSCTSSTRIDRRWAIAVPHAVAEVDGDAGRIPRERPTTSPPVCMKQNPAQFRSGTDMKRKADMFAALAILSRSSPKRAER